MRVVRLSPEERARGPELGFVVVADHAGRCALGVVGAQGQSLAENERGVVAGAGVSVCGRVGWAFDDIDLAGGGELSVDLHCDLADSLSEGLEFSSG